MLEQHAVTRDYYVELKFDVREVGDATPLDLEVVVDQLMDALDDVDGLTDVDMGANLSDSTIEFCVHLQAASQPDAHRAAVLAVRTAIHAAGGHTPDWEQSFENLFANEQYQSTVNLAGPVAV